jgi:hypothetical protein
VAGQAYHDWREFSDASRIPEQEVCYRVIVVEDDGVNREERSSAEVPALRDRCTRPPLGPTALTARAASWSTIDLAWADNSALESGYRVERALGGEPYFHAVATLGPGATAYRDTGRDPNTTYRYRVYALAGDGHSDPSNDAAVTTPPAP